MPEANLYERLGGAEAIGPAVDDFYRRVLNDPALKQFFAATMWPV